MTDPDVEHVPVAELLSKVSRTDLWCGYMPADHQEYLRERAALIDLEKAGSVEHGNPVNSTDTVYLATADKDGNACSFIASNYAGARF